jgi:hypothetical protein
MKEPKKSRGAAAGGSRTVKAEVGKAAAFESPREPAPAAGKPAPVAGKPAPAAGKPAPAAGKPAATESLPAAPPVPSAPPCPPKAAASTPKAQACPPQAAACPPQALASLPKTSAGPLKAPVAPPKAEAPETMPQAILAELASLRRMIEKLSAPQAPAGPPQASVNPPKASASDDAQLESGVDSMRRLLSELLESRLDPLIAEVAAIRTLAASEAEGKAGSVVDRLDLLLNDMGAARFEAQRLDYYDPLIHVVLEERRDAGAPDRVILETVVPGYRTQRGRVVAKAGVAINRRS